MYLFHRSLLSNQRSEKGKYVEREQVIYPKMFRVFYLTVNFNHKLIKPEIKVVSLIV